MTAYSSVMCFALRRAAAGALCFSLFRPIEHREAERAQ
ncbi:hypothetical protein GGD40_002884 [Paraburkholderia bryophila]|uniref:Uncharacterized protein n=1 Tax=Paraburkholderia bryophila TaxID=420952 RepID=A0A7Z0B829_9BURK|nr:hypothetical protein [Paraburkholderia bryophila]